MIDTHCHIDLYSNPQHIANECERLGIITIGMTNLPSHFEMGYRHLLSFRKVRLALGMHPLHAELHKKELSGFIRNISKTSYIGEIGLDYSKDGISTKDIQLESFRQILNILKGEKKILSIHSRKAEKDVLELLIEYKISNAIFHWYSGPLTLIEEISDSGFYFSVNPAMIKSNSGQELIKRIPKEKLLTESDGPFIMVENRQARPTDIKFVLHYLSNLWNISIEQTDNLINQNFGRIITNIKDNKKEIDHF